MSEKPEGFHEHHRQKRRGGDERPVNKLYVSPVLHEWIEKHPEEATELGWTVSQYEDPADVVVVIPDKVESDRPKRAKQAKTPEERKARQNFTIRTPPGEEQIIPELVQLARERFAAERGWKKNVPAHYIVVLALHNLLSIES